jgi:hypothetical protein
MDVNLCVLATLREISRAGSWWSIFVPNSSGIVANANVAIGATIAPMIQTHARVIEGLQWPARCRSRDNLRLRVNLFSISIQAANPDGSLGCFCTD